MEKVPHDEYFMFITFICLSGMLIEKQNKKQ